MLEKVVWKSSFFPAPETERVFESLPDALLRIARAWPDRPAVLTGQGAYSFQDLACRASGLAQEISQADASPGPVALVQSLGFDTVAAWFACAIAGRVLLLLEPDHPPARLMSLIESAGCSLVIVDQETERLFRELPDVKPLISDGRRGSLNFPSGLDAESPALIFPTSGSTGTPKLVTYSATTLAAKVQSSVSLMQVPDGARVVIVGSPGNYGFLHHAFVFLMSGGAVCLANVKAGGFEAVLDAIDRLGARHVRFTPSLFRRFAAWPKAAHALRRLEAVRFGGEPLLASDLVLAKAVLGPSCLIQNAYGSTESAQFIWSSDNASADARGATVPIGHIYPLAEYAIVPLEDGEEDATTGELLLRSAFQALGDYRGGVIDQSRFPVLPGKSGDRIYATGDVVRQLPDGSLLHLGRKGRMIKIRGHRVSLGEIENHLRAMPDVTAVAVVEHREAEESSLYAFIATGSGNNASAQASEWLAFRLPDFMRPRAVVTVAQIPLLPGGKVDYQGLLALVPQMSPKAHANTDLDDEFNRLTVVWDAVLWDGAHKHDSDFLSLGGDSLKLMTLAAEVERVFAQRMPLDQFLADSTLNNLAVLLGIEPPQLLVVQKGLRARQVWPGQALVKGVALAVPGWSGKATAVPFGRAGLFADYDLWAADFYIPSGNMLSDQRWWHAAQAIVKGIEQGTIPAPTVIFGYSFGGSLAWLVARLLAGSANPPSFVVMVDAAPLHRLRRFRHRALKQALAKVSHAPPPPVLHIRRSPLPDIGVGIGDAGLWQQADNIQAVVDLPTVDHLEMVRYDMLALAAVPVAAFLRGEPFDLSTPTANQLPDIYGVKIHQAATNAKTDLKGLIEEFLGLDANLGFRSDYFVALLSMACAAGNREQVEMLVTRAFKKYPFSRLVQYAKRRLVRNPKLLCVDTLPALFPSNIGAVERALAKPSDNPYRYKSSSISLPLLAFDAGYALLAAQWVRVVQAKSRLG